MIAHPAIGAAFRGRSSDRRGGERGDCGGRGARGDEVARGKLCDHVATVRFPRGRLLLRTNPVHGQQARGEQKAQKRAETGRERTARGPRYPSAIHCIAPYARHLMGCLPRGVLGHNGGELLCTSGPLVAARAATRGPLCSPVVSSPRCVQVAVRAREGDTARTPDRIQIQN